MEKKTLKKLSLKKEAVTIMNTKEQSQLLGGGTTSFRNCSNGMFCCNSVNVSFPKSCCGTNCDCAY